MTSGYPQAAPIRDQGDLARFEHVDALVRDAARARGAALVQYPALIARAALEQAEYPEAFPHLLMSASSRHQPSAGDGLHLSAEPLPTAWCLSPAVCYHTYASLAGRVLREPIAVTARGRCFRAECHTEPGVRQVEFEMREVVLLGPPAWVEASAEAVRHDVETLARGLGLDGDWHAAEDPFFLPAATGKALMQRLLEVKREYVRRGDPPLALASVNRHGAFFGKRFGITTTDGEPAHTACVAVGLDRWWRHVRQEEEAQS